MDYQTKGLGGFINISKTFKDAVRQIDVCKPSGVHVCV